MWGLGGRCPGQFSACRVQPLGTPLGKYTKTHLVTGRARWEGCRESTRCSRDTYPESYITKYTSIRRLTSLRRRASSAAKYSSTTYGTVDTMCACMTVSSLDLQAQTVVAGEGGGVQSARGGRGREMSFPLLKDLPQPGFSWYTKIRGDALHLCVRSILGDALYRRFFCTLLLFSPSYTL